MAARVTSAFLYVDDIVKSIEFYNEVVGAEIAAVHAEEEGGPISLAIGLLCVCGAGARQQQGHQGGCQSLTCGDSETVIEHDGCPMAG